MICVNKDRQDPVRAVRLQAARSGWRAGLALVTAPLMGCSSLTSIFNKEEDYVPEDPADKLYNEGLFLLNKKQDYETAAKKFDRSTARTRIPIGRARRC